MTVDFALPHCSVCKSSKLYVLRRMQCELVCRCCCFYFSICMTSPQTHSWSIFLSSLSTICGVLGFTYIHMHINTNERTTYTQTHMSFGICGSIYVCKCIYHVIVWPKCPLPHDGMLASACFGSWLYCGSVHRWICRWGMQCCCNMLFFTFAFLNFAFFHIFCFL